MTVPLAIIPIATLWIHIVITPITSPNIILSCLHTSLCCMCLCVCFCVCVCILGLCLSLFVYACLMPACLFNVARCYEQYKHVCLTHYQKPFPDVPELTSNE